MARPKEFDLEKAQIQAMQLFWRKGYAATSVENLVETLNLSRSSLYHTFGDKRTLFLTVLKLYSQRVIDRITRELEKAASPIAAIEALFEELAAEAGTKSGDQGCFMVNSIAELVPYDPDVTAIATNYSETLQRLLTEALRRADQEGMAKRNQTSAQLAAYVFNVMQGMRVLIKSGTTREELQAIGRIALRTLQ
jgi:TetR/AcrR family transcriptional repressor of nem operon